MTATDPRFSDDFKRNLMGRTVVGFVSVDIGSGTERWPGLKMDDGSIVLIQTDAEGNGGGFMSLIAPDGSPAGCAG